MPTPDARLLDELRSRLRGTLMGPTDPGYDEHRSIWNAMIDRRPARIVRCLGTADVVAGVRFARQHDLTLSIKAGGHNIAGLAVCDDGLMLDLSQMRGVHVDPWSRIARAQGGCLLGDVDRETQLHGLAAVLGFVSATGIAGLTLGGGFGYLTRRFGWTSDNVTAMEVVTAEGRVVRASEQENADLFWGLRGGGGNFGVVTHIDYRLHPVGPEIVAGAIAWRAEDAPAVLAMYRQLIESAPPELTCAMVFRPAPPAPWIQKELHGRPVVVLVVCCSGTIAEGDRLVAPLKAFGSPVGDVLVRRPYTSQQSLLDATQPKGRRYYWKSEYLPRVEPALIDRLLAHGHTFVSPHSALILFPIDGALNQLAPEHSAAGNRDARVVLNLASSWERPEDDRRGIEWARTVWQDTRRFSTGGAYINFQTDDEGSDRLAAAYGGNLARLVEVKTRWDPDNLFRTNKNIAPRGRSGGGVRQPPPLTDS
jgi:FAD/FMN-containing dehydrogenase